MWLRHRKYFPTSMAFYDTFIISNEYSFITSSKRSYAFFSLQVEKMVKYYYYYYYYSLIFLFYS